MRNIPAARKILILLGFFAASGQAPAQVISLGGAEDVTILGATTVTNAGDTIVYGNLALTPGSSVTGFPPGQIVNGAIHINDGIANAARAGALNAYNQLAGETPTANLTGQNLSGMILTSGIYKFDTFAQLSGTLTLNTGGDPNAPFHFLIGSALTVDSNSSVSLLNGNSVNIFWQVGSSATIGTDSAFVGNIIANQSITMERGATLEGRLLALNGAVTLDSNIIRPPTAAATATPGATATPTPGPTATPDPTATPAPTATPLPTATPGPTASPTATPDPTATPAPTATPEPTATPDPTATPGPTTTPAPTATPAPTTTPGPTASPTATPGSTPGPGPTVTPSPAPGASATPAPPELPPNAVVIVQALDLLPPNHPLIILLGDLPDEHLPGALILLSPSDLSAIFTGGFAVLDAPRNNIDQRLWDVRQTTTSSRDSSQPVADTRPHDGKEMLSSDGKQVVSSAAPAPAPVAVDHRWGFFISGTGGAVDVESTSAAQGSDLNTLGITVGADYRVSDRFVLGAALSYSNFDADLNLGGSLESNGAQAHLYGTYYTGGFYVNGIVGAGVSSVETRRLTAGGYAEGETDTASFTASIGTGYDFKFGAFSVGPLAALRYGRIGLDDFTEQGALGAMYIDGQSQESLRSALGLQASYAAQLGRITLTPFARVQWEHEFRTSTPTIRAGFIPSEQFTVQGPHVGRDALLLDLGASAQLTPRVGIFSYYRGELARKNYNVHSITAGVRVSF